LFTWVVIFIKLANMFDWTSAFALVIAVRVDGFDFHAGRANWGGQLFANIARFTLVTNVFRLVFTAWSGHVTVESFELVYGTCYIWWGGQVTSDWLGFDRASSRTSVPDARVLGRNPNITDLEVIFAVVATWAIDWLNTLTLVGDSAWWTVATFTVQTNVFFFVVLVVGTCLSDAWTASFVNHVSFASLWTNGVRSPLKANS